MSLDDYAAIGLNVSCRDINGESYVLNEQTRDFYIFQGSGSFIWSLIDGTKQIREIIKICLGEYDGCQSEISDSVISFIEQMRDLKLLVFDVKEFEGVMSSV